MSIQESRARRPANLLGRAREAVSRTIPVRTRQYGCQTTRESIGLTCDAPEAADDLRVDADNPDRPRACHRPGMDLLPAGPGGQTCPLPDIRPLSLHIAATGRAAGHRGCRVAAPGGPTPGFAPLFPAGDLVVGRDLPGAGARDGGLRRDSAHLDVPDPVHRRDRGLDCYRCRGVSALVLLGDPPPGAAALLCACVAPPFHPGPWPRLDRSGAKATSPGWKVAEPHCFCRTASASISSWIFSLTMTPPGIGALKLTPKSLRLISPRAEKPARVLPPKGSWPNPLTSTFSDRGRVTPRNVNSPSTMKSSPSRRIPVDRNVMVGLLAASKKFSERRSLSRISLAVSTDAKSMLAVADDSSGFSAVMMRASNFVNLPLTLLTIR